ncbi:hypothetical protein ACOME3_002677 [Neoechinorhynchus agilis]
MDLSVYFCWLIFLFTPTEACPLLPDSPCHCGVRNDSTSYIQCSGLGLREIPKFTLSFTYDELHLIDNYISRIEDNSFSKLRVRKIYLTGNPISYVSKSAFKPLSRQLELLHLDVVTPSLDEDDLDEEPITSIDTTTLAFLCLPRLVNIRLKGFQLERLPGLCPNLTRLTNVALLSCGLRLIDYNHGPFINVKHLDVSLNPLLETVPTSLFPNIESLNLSGNAINQPIENSSMSTVKTLDLSKNGIDKWLLPELSNLEHLILDKNRLTILDQTPIYTNLKTLSVRHNKISTVFKSFSSKLPNLHTLDLFDNQLVNFDCQFTNPKIENLNLGSNHLTVAPSNLPITIKSLDISNNVICSFSAPIVHSFTRINDIFVHDNPIFCDCNIRWLKIELMRRKIKGVKCTLPIRLKSMDLINLTDTQCVPEVPACVHLAHGPYVRIKEDFVEPHSSNETSEITERTETPREKSNLPSISSITLHYISSYDTMNRPRKSILVNWKLHSYKKVRGIRVSIVPRQINSKSSANLFQYSTVLPSSSRHFVIHGVKPDVVYTICAEPLGHVESYGKMCKDLRTIGESNVHAAAEVIKAPLGEVNTVDARMLIAASIMIGSVLVSLSLLILFMAFSKPRKRSIKSPLMKKLQGNQYLTNTNLQMITSSAMAGAHFDDRDRLMDYFSCHGGHFLSPHTISPNGGGTCCCSCNFQPITRLHDEKSSSEINQQNTTDTRITSALGGRHLYHEIANACSLENEHHSAESDVV